MTHFNSIFNNKKTVFQFKIKFIKAHEILFINNALNEFNVIVRDIIKNMFDNYIKKIVIEFKKQNVYVVKTCVIVIFEYELMNSSESFKSLFHVTYVKTEKIQIEKLTQTSQLNNCENFENIENMIFINFTKSNLIIFENIISFKHTSFVDIVLHVFKLTFDIFSIVLQRVGDRNVFLIFFWNLSAVEKTIQYVQKNIFWNHFYFFLNYLMMKFDFWNSKVLKKHFFKFEIEFDQFLSKNYIMRSQIYAQKYFLKTWFINAIINNENRMLKLSSTTAFHIKKIQWLGFNIVSICLNFESLLGVNWFI